MDSMLSCTPGIVFATLSVLSVVASAFVGWRAFVADVFFHALIMFGVYHLCKRQHTTTLWWLLAIFVGLPAFLAMAIMATGGCKCCAAAAEQKQASA